MNLSLVHVQVHMVPIVSYHEELEKEKWFPIWYDKRDGLEK
jgi:hypothetical protein